LLISDFDFVIVTKQTLDTVSRKFCLSCRKLCNFRKLTAHRTVYMLCTTKKYHAQEFLAEESSV